MCVKKTAVQGCKIEQERCSRGRKQKDARRYERLDEPSKRAAYDASLKKAPPSWATAAAPPSSWDPRTAAPGRRPWSAAGRSDKAPKPPPFAARAEAFRQREEAREAEARKRADVDRLRKATRARAARVRKEREAREAAERDARDEAARKAAERDAAAERARSAARRRAASREFKERAADANARRDAAAERRARAAASRLEEATASARERHRPAARIIADAKATYDLLHKDEDDAWRAIARGLAAPEGSRARAAAQKKMRDELQRHKDAWSRREAEEIADERRRTETVASAKRDAERAARTRV